MVRTLGGALVVGLVVMVVSSACGTPSASPSGAAAPRDGLPLAETRYACDGPPGFLPGLLDEPANAEREEHPSAAALREAIARGGPDIDLLPDADYWLVSRERGVAHYLAQAPSDEDIDFVSAIVEDTGAGWKLAGWGQCQPQIVLAGLSLATWVLDPDLPTPDADTTTFSALVTERACASGQAMGGRLRPPSITYADDSVIVVFAAVPPPGDGLQTCPSNPSMRAVVELRETLADRDLLDGAFFPPVEPIAPES